MESPDSILKFWFGEEKDPALVVRKKSKLWFGKLDTVDAGIRYRFADCLDLAANGHLDDWLATPLGRLAFILLTDQFPRNMFRGKSMAFDYDHLARHCCKEGLKLNVHRDLLPIQRVFFYLPLEHSESIEDQELSLRLFDELLVQTPPPYTALFQGYGEYARQHYEIIKRFGRFPHRNHALSRNSTDEEDFFLSQKQHTF